MFVNDIFKKKQLDEGGPFSSTEPKKPKKGSVADLAAQKRKEQERGKQPIEPKDQRVGVARVKKDVAEDTSTPNVVDRDGIKVSHRWNQGRLVIDALSGDGNKKLGSVYFMNYGTKEKPKFQGEELFVDERYRGQGIATIMYDVAKEILGKVYPSDAQTQAGKKFWQSKKVWEQGVAEGSAQKKLYKRHQELRKKSGLPDPDYYKELKASYDLPDEERHAKQKEIKQKYKVTNEDREQYIEELQRAGYEIVTEKRMTCPECGGAAYEDRMLAEKQDACYHKVKSRYKVWPSAYASGALVRCRKKGAANWGNKSKK